MGKRKLKSVDELDLRLWRCTSCESMECELVSYKRPVDCNTQSSKEKRAVPKWILIEILK